MELCTEIVGPRADFQTRLAPYNIAGPIKGESRRRVPVSSKLTLEQRREERKSRNREASTNRRVRRRQYITDLDTLAGRLKSEIAMLESKRKQLLGSAATSQCRDRPSGRTVNHLDIDGLVSSVITTNSAPIMPAKSRETEVAEPAAFDFSSQQLTPSVFLRLQTTLATSTSPNPLGWLMSLIVLILANSFQRFPSSLRGSTGVIGSGAQRTTRAVASTRFRPERRRCSAVRWAPDPGLTIRGALPHHRRPRSIGPRSNRSARRSHQHPRSIGQRSNRSARRSSRRPRWIGKPSSSTPGLTQEGIMMIARSISC